MKFDQMRLATVLAVSTAVLGGCGPSGQSAANCGQPGANRDWNNSNSGGNPANCQRTGGGGGAHFFFFGGGARSYGAPAAASRGGFGGTAGMAGGEGGVGE